MIHQNPITTSRLDLVPATLGILKSELENPEALGRDLNATIPPSWPPELLDRETLAEFVRMKAANSDPLFMTWYWILRQPPGGTRILVGSGGITSFSRDTDAVIIGYSVLPEFRNRGYATEAVSAMIAEIFRIHGIQRITAMTHPHLLPSVRVLEKTGFIFSGPMSGGEGIEEGTALYIREKS